MRRATTTSGTTPAHIERELTRIACQHLRIETLEARNSDRLDFHEVSVWSLRDALQAAFDAGIAHGQASQTPTHNANA
ncbi:hypothetical protein [Ralstonia sp.]|uniref:DUF6900 domain-containing protein n=1 Tax=Ralstonia sp. TaxID=54061 RepID=UPI0031D4DC0F